MAVFAVTYSYEPEAAATRADLFAEHRTWLSHIDAEDRLLGAGVFADKSGSLLVFRADSSEALEHDLNEDPFAQAGAIAVTDVREWTPNWGVLALAAENDRS
ncbi:YciI family protein [Arthrobacter sp. I2-34]|uniref:YciI family protein n=1 Tax=Arthrobacter hankyongi TaxID=2904801 RepID=A0ABS9LBQ9_9MICC|nr:YciI family protein [Arthrobacter hankyongi]MCG2624117.1 YciI family protein [Arthrobacter hankyongi]